MAVVTIPAVPEGWHGRDLVRLVDPLGLVAGWIAPGLAGVLVGCHARLANPGPWQQIVRAPANAKRFAFEPMLHYDGGDSVPVRMVGGGWRLAERDPTGAVVNGVLEGQPVSIVTRCDDGGLSVGIEILRPPLGAMVRFGPLPAPDWPIEGLTVEVEQEVYRTGHELNVRFVPAGTSDTDSE